MLKLNVLILLFVPVIVLAQEKVGIKWEEGLSWAEVKEKAEKEDKYIFVDAFTTWCKPCKVMDQYVYTNDTVGNYFNNRFISIRVQMDKTEKDNQYVRLWYDDASAFVKKYRIIAYPSFIFLSPTGSIVHKEIGVKTIKEFITIGELALKPGKKYDDPYAEYDRLVNAYEAGKKEFDKMPYMFKTAMKLGNRELAKAVMKEYNSYVLKLRDEEIYTKENIEYFSKVISSKSPLFPLFYPDGKKVDAVMGKYYARNIVDEIIAREIYGPFLNIKIGGAKMMGGIVEVKSEPKWNILYDSIVYMYNADYARRNLMDAKIEWYDRQQNYELWAKNLVKRYKRYGVDKSNEEQNGRINFVSWIMFENVSNKKYLRAAVSWMEAVVAWSAKNAQPFAQGLFFDTYACLLYKIGKVQEAIFWEEKAEVKMRISGALDQAAEFQHRIVRMKKHESLN